MAAAQKRSADEGKGKGTPDEGQEEMRASLGYVDSTLSATSEDSELLPSPFACAGRADSAAVAAVAAGAVAEEEDSLALPTEMLWQPAAEEERRVPLRMERHVLWPADLVV